MWLLMGCSQKNNSEPIKQISKKIDILLDTTFASGNFFKIYRADDTKQFYCQYGTNKWDSTINAYDYNVESEKIFKIWGNDSYISLSVSCGSPYHYEVIFPLNKQEKIRSYFQTILTTQTERNSNLLAYLDTTNFECLHIEDMKTQKNKRICLKPLPKELLTLIFCIDSAYYSEKTLYLRWYDGKDSKIDKIFNVNLD